MAANEAGDFDQARRWWRSVSHSDDRSHAAEAMVNLGSLEEQQGQLDETRRWYLAAVDTTHPDLADALVTA